MKVKLLAWVQLALGVATSLLLIPFHTPEQMIAVLAALSVEAAVFEGVNGVLIAHGAGH